MVKACVPLGIQPIATAAFPCRQAIVAAPRDDAVLPEAHKERVPEANTLRVPEAGLAANIPRHTSFPLPLVWVVPRLHRLTWISKISLPHTRLSDASSV